MVSETYWFFCSFLFSLNFILCPSTEPSPQPEELERLLSGHHKKAEPNEFPWLVLMSLRKYDGEVNSCAGSILSEQWILTSAYCVMDASLARVYTGVIFSHMKFGKPLLATEFFTHEDNNGKNSEVDLGLIKLMRNFTFRESVQPIQLPDHELEDFAVVTLPGWEWDDQKKNWTSSYLHYQELSVTPIAECRKYYGYISNSSFCTTTGPDQNSCESNSGDGAIAYYADEATLVGVHSFVAAQCEPNSPMGFVRVYQYKSWIQEITGL